MTKFMTCAKGRPVCVRAPIRLQTHADGRETETRGSMGFQWSVMVHWCFVPVASVVSLFASKLPVKREVVVCSARTGLIKRHILPFNSHVSPSWVIKGGDFSLGSLLNIHPIEWNVQVHVYTFFTGWVKTRLAFYRLQIQHGIWFCDDYCITVSFLLVNGKLMADVL